MTKYILDKQTLFRPGIQKTLLLSNDPVRKVAAELHTRRGIYYGANTIMTPDANISLLFEHNRPLARLLVTHAEIAAIKAFLATNVLEDEMLAGSMMYVSLEPCKACRAVIEMMGVEMVIFGERYLK
jgi:tRNA(Arg) A34 adenosine deaminase TadA